MSSNKSKWIWYKGDFELYHSQKLHLRRTERGIVLPAFWYMPEICHNIRIYKTVDLDKSETICITANGVGCVKINDTKYASFGSNIVLPAGKHEILIQISNPAGLPCIYIEGDTVKSDESWLVDNYDGCKKTAGCSEMYTDKDVTPEIFFFSYKKIYPLKICSVKNGILYDFGRETFAELRFTRIDKPITVYYGETEIEALDIENCYTFDIFDSNITKTYGKGFRYLYIPGISKDEIKFDVLYEYLPVERKSSFRSDNEILNRIWEAAANTFELNSREFYLDGIKRDRWVWSGDAYQSYFINRYLCFDEDITKRTIIALGGKGIINQHINTIPDYTFYWLISIYDYYEMTGNHDFVSEIFPRMSEFMDFVKSRLDNNGFITKSDEDWVFIDWADIDKTGAVCAEQMLLLKSLEAYIRCAEIAGMDHGEYDNMQAELKEKINKYFWNEQKGAFIDSFESGKNNVTRHANIFALLFGYADEKQRDSIIKNVIFNDAIPQITTPYFKFYELEAMCIIGENDYAAESIIKYWGPMIEAGATSFWEEFSPDMPWQEQLGMYDLKYGKSLCHAWGASPIYLLGRYFLGIKPTGAGYETFEVRPKTQYFNSLNAIVPVKNGKIEIEKSNKILTIKSDRYGGVVVYGDKKYPLEKDKEIKIQEAV